MRAETRVHDRIWWREKGRKPTMLTTGSDNTSRAAGVGDLREGSMDPDGVEGGADPGEEGSTDPGGLSLRNGARRRGPGGVRRAQLEEERAT
jgi:hypothetical protein